MSIGAAFNAAGSGLTASARLAETISANVANALTEGYARRSVGLSSVPLGGHGSGVRVLGTARAEQAQITAERRIMDAESGAARAIAEARERVLAAVGMPGEAGSLAARVTAFETALLAAAASPSASLKLEQAAEAARSLVGAINDAAEAMAAIRTDAEAEIERQVGVLNSTLHDIAALNRKIRIGMQQGLETASLEDERTRALDRIADIVPLRTVRREGGEIAIYTANGGVLLDGRVWELAFERTLPVITPEMTGPLPPLGQDRGSASGPEAVSATGAGLMAGGSLGALFEVRDSIAPAMAGDLDAFAGDLVARFADLTEFNGGEAGLFTDPGAGGAGIAARLELNPLVDPAHGGEARRLRDGLASAAPGPVGFGGHLQALVDAMTESRNPGNMVSTSAAATAAGLAAEIGAWFGAQAAQAEEARAFFAGQSAILGEREASLLGVDTDAELQFLMLVEQSYAANARVLTVIDSLLRQLLEI